MKTTTRIGLLAVLLLAGRAVAAEDPTPSSLRAKVAALRVEDVAWRAIPWTSCLLEGLAEARASGKPTIVWVFIDRPVDDGRC